VVTPDVPTSAQERHHRVEPSSVFATAVNVIPGIGLLGVIGYAGKQAEALLKGYGKAHHVALPNVEYVLWAILIGLLVGNLFAKTRVFAIFSPGIDTYEFFLKLGIVLLGARFLLADVFKLGGLSLVLIVLEFAVAGSLMIVLGRAFKLGPKLTALLAVGSSICGVSAIIATQGAIEADDEDASYAIGAILALGAVGLFLFPAIGHALHMNDHAFGLWVGLAIDNTAEVAGRPRGRRCPRTCCTGPATPAPCSRARTAEDRLRAVVAGAHGDAFLIERSADVLGADAVETNERTPAFSAAVPIIVSPGTARDARSRRRAARARTLDGLEPDRAHVVERGAEPHGVGDVARARLEARRGGWYGLLERHVLRSCCRRPATAASLEHRSALPKSAPIPVGPKTL
jgi:hypothetical protein